ncbi:MAG: energy transducer TonB [Candidatus Nitrotoga sp.]|nr:energy transducer TonB [Candidatus Nitrotoga sp.]
MSAISLFSAPHLPIMTWPQVKRLVPLLLIILLHIGFIYALLSGWLYQTEQVLPKAEQGLPKEVFVSLITVDNTPEPMPPEPQPTPPNPVPVVKQTITPPPVIPVINRTPSEQAITTPPVPPQSPVPPQPAVVAPPAEPVPSAPPMPAPPPPPSQPKTVSIGVEYLQAPAPEYPPLARRMGEEGRVTLRVLVNETGRPTRVDVQKTSGSPRLDEAARQAVLHAMFKPHIEDGRATTVYAIVPITFHLDN